MKRLLIILAIVFLCLSATLLADQLPDRLIIGEDTIYLKSFPLDDLRLKKSPFTYGGYPFSETNCLRGYIATWQIVDNHLTLQKVQKLDSVGTQLNIAEYLSDNGYSPQIIDGNIVADWYSDTLKSYDFFIYNFAYKLDKFYVSKDYLNKIDSRTELVFEDGKLVSNDIIPIESYKPGDTLRLDVYYYANWFAGYKSVLMKGIIRENNGKKVKLEISSLGTNSKIKKWKLKKEIPLDYIWVNPRYCERVD